MTLRFTTLDGEGHLGEEVLLDDRICDCCDTDAVLDAAGHPVIVYRDRSGTEVRDISMVRRTGDGWSAPAPVFEDGWTIAGCPVNGPAMAAFGDRVRKAIEQAGELGDAGLEDIFTEVSRSIDKHTWFVEAHGQAKA